MKLLGSLVFVMVSATLAVSVLGSTSADLYDHRKMKFAMKEGVVHHRLKDVMTATTTSSFNEHGKVTVNGVDSTVGESKDSFDFHYDTRPKSFDPYSPDNN